MTALSDLPGLGEKSSAMLVKAGINTVVELQQIGAVMAYWRVKQNDAKASLNLLWALQGALTGAHWQTVARQQRLSLLLELDRLTKTQLTPPDQEGA